ncbi:MAG TPA: substrate-binding domain-containing protein [Thermoleophilaceae bacterium]
MKRSQLLILAVAVIAVIAAVLVQGGDGNDPGGGGVSAEPQAPKGAIAVSFPYSLEKEKLLKPLIRRFNDTAPTVRGKQVFVEGEVVSSGEVEDKIANGSLRPVAWSPASSLWGRLLNFDADRAYVRDRNPSIVRTPLVIAMWEPMAQALGYPKKAIGFADVLRVATSGQGWGAVGRPEFGDFKLVHTNPDFSTSGLSAVVAEYYAATGKSEGLTEADVVASEARLKVRSIERSIVHYGDTTLFIADEMKKNGAGYASAVAMEEVTLLEFNRTRGAQQKLVAIYPKEGTFYSDNPFIILDAPWVSAAKRAGARLFQRFLREHVTPELAARSGFRPADRGEPLVPPIEPANGVDPSQPTRVLQPPEPRVLNRIRIAWRRDRKPANVMLVVDVSGSMEQENRLTKAKDGLGVFFDEAAPNDRLGLTSFSDVIKPLVPVEGRFHSVEQELRATVQTLSADGGTSVYDATADALKAVRSLDDDTRINAIVVLTDGDDTDSSLDASDVIELVSNQDDSAPHVRVFTIAYSPEAAGAARYLKDIAAGSGGKAYLGSTENIEAVYRSISSFF